MRNNELYHYGIKGMKWGVRRYQNEDGTYTEAGRLRYFKINPKDAKNSTTRKVAEDYHQLTNSEFLKKYKAHKYQFAARYVRTKGDTYTLGKKRAEKAKKILSKMESLGLEPNKTAKRRAEKYVKFVKATTGKTKQVKDKVYSKKEVEDHLRSAFGNDMLWKDKSWMKQVWGIDDPYAWAQEDLRRRSGRHY